MHMQELCNGEKNNEDYANSTIHSPRTHHHVKSCIVHKVGRESGKWPTTFQTLHPLTVEDVGKETLLFHARFNMSRQLLLV